MESSRPAAIPYQDAAAASEEAQPQHIDDLSVQWDQTYLRLNYILGNLGGPVAAAGADNNSSFSSASARTGAEGAAAGGAAGGASSSATPGRRNSLGNGAGDKVSKSVIPNFPALSRPDAARKVAQIGTWRDEVASHFDAVLCGCSLGSSAAISAADDAPSCSVTKGLLPAAFVAGSLASPAVRPRRKASLIAAAASISRDDDGSGASSNGSGDDADGPVESVCALCGRHGDVRDLVAESWPSDGGAARKALRRMQLSLLRIGRRRQLLPRAEGPFPPDAEPKSSHTQIESHHQSAAAAATLPTDLKPAAAVATTSMYHYRTDPDDQDDEDLSSDDSTSAESHNGMKRQKSKPVGSGGASKTLAAREQMERNQRAKDARLRRAQKLLEKSLVVAPKTTGVQS
ncbi:uncharacterized protein PgNI_02985 [Pyricularia grisea]|uniref:Uncharacterized protein n=1 Tax=Pyricularia grisea TaxID=148305 RepID=A0A6P8BBM1_PYRGI|nr:uncharacterized protein PgNI_02985 [Pyricularia grisea]TLD13092.1 hypothetical protein PgNI_02985 [Pyricularia grisea]